MKKALRSFVITVAIFLWLGLLYWLYNIDPILGAVVTIFPIIWSFVYMAVLDIWED